MTEKDPPQIHIYAPLPNLIIPNTDQTEKWNHCMCCNKTRLMINTERWIFEWFEQEQHCIQGKGCRRKEKDQPPHPTQPFTDLVGI